VSSIGASDWVLDVVCHGVHRTELSISNECFESTTGQPKDGARDGHEMNFLVLTSYLANEITFWCHNIDGTWSEVVMHIGAAMSKTRSPPQGLFSGSEELFSGIIGFARGFVSKHQTRYSGRLG
jgi:hypothetical protein